MLSILESINLSAEYLQKKGVENPRRNAEILLCKVLNCNKINLYLNFERPLADDEVALYRNLLKRRGDREPLQYITGIVEFYGLEFSVNPSVLIPRPETELLVEKVIEDYKERNVKILDIGTGSGNIAVSLANNLSLAKITALDKSIDALKTASLNAAKHGCSEKIEFLNADIMSSEMQKSEVIYDVIVSNPPYIAEHEFKQLEPELRMYEPKIALSDYSDGISFYRRILDLSDSLLSDKARVYFEIGQGQSERIQTLMNSKNFCNITVIKDYQGIDRILTGDKNESSGPAGK